MMKSLLHTLRFALLAATLSAAQSAVAFDPAHPGQSSSFRGGFSSQRQQAAPPVRRPAAAPQSSRPAQPSQPAAGRGGGFGSFGAAPARETRQSDSALSRRLDKNASEANALRTLDERRAAQERASRDTRPVPGYEDRQAAQASGMPAPTPMPAPAPPVIVRQDSAGGVGQVVTGYVLGRMANGVANGGSHNAPTLPASYGGGKVVGTASIDQPPPGRSFFGGVLHLFMWLAAAAALVWLAYFAVRRLRRRRAANQPNYTFERN